MYPRRGYEMYARRGHDRWFPDPGMLYEPLWQDEPQPMWDQCHSEQQWNNSQWKHDYHYNHHYPANFESGNNYRGRAPYRGSYWRRPRGNSHKKSYHRGRSNKGPKSSISKESDVNDSSRSSNLINVTTDKKKSDTEKAKAPSEVPKEPKQDQTDSAASAKQSNPCQGWTSTGLVTIYITGDDLTSKLEKLQSFLKIESRTANVKVEDCDSQASCAPAVTLSSSVTVENLTPIKKEEEIVPIQTEGHPNSSSLSEKSLQVQAAEGHSKQISSLPSAEVLSEKQSSSQTTKGFRSMVKEELMPVAVTKQDATHPSVTNLSSVIGPSSHLKGKDAIPSLGKKKPALKNLQDQLKGNQTAEDLSHCSTPLTSIKVEQQAPFKIAKYFHSMEKEEPVQLAEDPSQKTTSIPSSEVPIKEEGTAEITEVAHSVKKEEPLLLEASQPTHHFSSSVLIEIPFLFDTTDDHQSERLEETELTQVADSHEDGDHNQTSVKPVTSDSSSFLTTTSNVHSVPVLVRGKETDLTDFWENPLHAEHLRGWAPEDYQEPPQSVEKADKCDRKSDRDKVPYHSSLSCHTHVSCDKKSDTRRALEGRSCSPKHRHSSGSRHSNTNRAPKELHVKSLPRHSRSPPRSPLRRGRSPPRRGRSPPRSLPRGRSPPRSPSQRCRSPQRSPPRRYRSLSQSPLQRRKSPTRSPLQLHWSPLHSSSQSPRQGDWSPPQSPPQPGWSPLRSSPRRDETRGSPQSPPRRDHFRFRDLSGSSRSREDNFCTSCCCLYHSKYLRKPSHERYQGRDFPSLHSAHKVHHHHSTREKNKSSRMRHSYPPESSTAGKKKKNITHSEVTEKKRATSGKARKEVKIKKKAIEAQALKSHDSLSSANEAAIPPKAAENLQPLRRKESELVQVAVGSEDPDFPCQHARVETGSPAQSWTPSGRTAAVLARKEEIDQAYQQVLLNFAAVATMLLETQPYMTEAVEAALQATLRKFGNYYECKLKDFIDTFDETEDS